MHIAVEKSITSGNTEIRIIIFSKILFMLESMLHIVFKAYHIYFSPYLMLKVTRRRNVVQRFEVTSPSLQNSCVKASILPVGVRLQFTWLFVSWSVLTRWNHSGQQFSFSWNSTISSFIAHCLFGDAYTFLRMYESIHFTLLYSIQKTQQHGSIKLQQHTEIRE